jgi:hypothetical protein
MAQPTTYRHGALSPLDFDEIITLLATEQLAAFRAARLDVASRCVAHVRVVSCSRAWAAGWITVYGLADPNHAALLIGIERLAHKHIVKTCQCSVRRYSEYGRLRSHATYTNCSNTLCRKLASS